MDDLKQKAVSFLNEIGIKAERGDVPVNSFLPDITIKDGTIIYNDKTHVSDILHEAGHLACIPGKYRSTCQADMGKNQKKIWDIVETAVKYKTTQSDKVEDDL